MLHAALYLCVARARVQLLEDNPKPPDSQQHLLKLIHNQITIYKNPGNRCNLWHTEVLDWCVILYYDICPVVFSLCPVFRRCAHVMTLSTPAYLRFSHVLW